MKIKQKHIFIAGGILIAAITGYLLYQKNMKKKIMLDSPIQTPVNTNTIGYGSKGTYVKQLQEWLNKNMPIPMATLDVDGVFGPKTQEALKSVTGKISLTLDELKSKIA